MLLQEYAKNSAQQRKLIFYAIFEVSTPLNFKDGIVEGLKRMG